MRTNTATATPTPAPLLNPENFRVPNVPNQNDQFAALRNTIDKMERDAAGTPAGDVTAAVTTRRARRSTASAPAPVERSNVLMSNAPSFDELCKKAEALGSDKGNGADAQIKFAMMVLEAAYLGALDLDPNKHGADRRDGIVLAERYMKGRTGATIFDTKSDSGRKLVSNLDKAIKLGSCPKWGQGQPLQNVNDLMTFRQREKKAGKKVDDAFNTLMRYATAQLKKETLITDDDLHGFVYKREPTPRDAVDVLESIRKVANNLKAGKVANCPDIDTSAEIQTIINACTKRIVAITKARTEVKAAIGAAVRGSSKSGNTSAPASAAA